MRTARFSGHLHGGGGSATPPSFHHTFPFHHLPFHYTPSPYTSFHQPTNQPPHRGQTKTCENITLPQTSFVGGRYVPAGNRFLQQLSTKNQRINRR